MPFEIITLAKTDSFDRAYSALKDRFGVLALDLAGWTFDLTVKDDPEATTNVIALTTAQFTVNNTLGQAGFSLNPTALNPLAVGRAYYFRTVAYDGQTYSTIDQGIVCRTP